MANKIYAQYRGKPKITAWSDIPKDLAKDVIDASSDISNSYSIDSNSGRQLDIIGAIVDQDRTVTDSIALPAFEMNDDGDVEFGDTEAQMSPRSVADDSDLSDDYYRYIIRSKIAKNNGSAEIDSILTAVNAAIPGLNATRLTDGEDMSFSIEFYGNIDEIARYLLTSVDVVPRPQGVKFNGFLEGANMPEMNDSGDFEFGDESAEMVGFIGV